MSLKSPQLNGTSQCFTISDSAQTGLQPSGSFSMGGWVKFDSLSSSPIFGGKYNTSASKREYEFLYNTGSSEMQMISSSNGTNASTILSQSYALSVTGDWVHLAYSYNLAAGEVEFFVNGLSIGSVSGGQTSIFNSDAAFYLGARGANNTGFVDGKMANWRFFSSQLSSSDWLNEMDSSVAIDSSCEGDWKLNGDGSDETSNGNDLSPVASPSYTNDSPMTDLELYGNVKYTDYIEATSQAAQVDGDFTDYPYYFDLSEVGSLSNLWTTIQSDGSDLRVFSQQKKQVAVLNGTNQYFSITDANQTGLDFTSNLTFNFSYRPASFAAEQDLVAKYAGSGNQRGYILRIETDGDMIFYFSPDGNSTLTNYNFSGFFNTVSDLDEQIDFSVSLDIASGTAFARRDGTSTTGTKTGTATSIFNNTATFAIGATDGGTKFLNGQISNVRAWDTNLTESEIDAEHASNNVVKTSNLQLNMDFNGNSEDESVNGNNLTNNSAATFLRDSTYLQDEFNVQNSLELVDIDIATKTGSIHFKGDTLSNRDVTFRLYFNGTSVKRDSDALYGSQDVWSNKKMVSHNGGSTLDSTGNYNLDSHGGLTSGGATGKIGLATLYDGLDDYVDLQANAINPNNNYTYSAWVKLLEDNTHNCLFSVENGDLSPTGYYALICRSDSLGTCMQIDPGSPGATFPPTGTQKFEVSDGLSLLHMVKNGTTYSLYKNGALIKTSTDTTTGFPTGLIDTIGWLNAGSGNYFDGEVSEARMETNPLSSDWISTEYKNQNSPATFWSVDSEGVSPSSKATFTGFSKI